MRTWLQPDLPDLSFLDSPDAPSHLTMWDTAAQSVTPLIPASSTATIYVCGITPYDATHLGHAFTYLTFDMVQRCWHDLGYEIHYVQNVTDVDDPLLERAEATGQDWRELAADQIELFRTDMEALRVLPPRQWVGATESIQMVSDLIVHLVEHGFVYQIDDEYPDWYFRNTRVDSFSQISHLDYDQQLAEFAAKGGDPDRLGKEHPLDALVWRMVRPGEPAWESPLGTGRPGWHIECTSIAQRYLGPAFDLQGGGSDLSFPHHEMCAATGTAATSEAFARHYVHTAMVGLDGEKMSKSLGNLELVSRLRVQGVEPAVIRVALLNHHYRTDWEWFARDIDAARQRIDLWVEAVRRAPEGSAAVLAAGLRQALRTDLDTPAALAHVDSWAQSLNSDCAQGDEPSRCEDVIDALLGIDLRNRI